MQPCSKLMYLPEYLDKRTNTTISSIHDNTKSYPLMLKKICIHLLKQKLINNYKYHIE